MPNHWGLMYSDLSRKGDVLWGWALPTIKDILADMYPFHETLQTKFWVNYDHLRRFGMPYQRVNNSRLVGAGSCGTGVIMAARDFIKKGHAKNAFSGHTVTWTFIGKILCFRFLIGHECKLINLFFMSWVFRQSFGLGHSLSYSSVSFLKSIYSSFLVIWRQNVKWISFQININNDSVFLE